MPKAGFAWHNMVDRETFIESIYLYCSGRITQSKAAKMCDISIPTWLKWANKAVLGEPIPDTFFKKDEK